MAHSRNKKRRSRHSDASVGAISVSRRGYGFVTTPEGEYFIPRGNVHGAMDGDVVEVVRMRRLEERRRGQAKKAAEGRRDMLGSVKRVVERAHTTVVGTLRYRDGLGVVKPSDERICHDIFIDPRAIGVPANDGDVVEVRLTTYPSRLEAAQGYIEEVVGRHDEQGMDIEVIIRRHKLETVFSAAALEEAAELVAQATDGAITAMTAVSGKVTAGETTVGETAAGELIPRRDLRERFIFTIDPSDARDFDDAISLDFIEGQMLLGVHIADVSAYVTWDSSIDLDARRRATSVYLPDRVLPMLPPQLSDDLCSLKPNVNRLAFTCDMLIRSDGTVQSYELYPSIICSRVRLSYDEVQAFFADGHTAAEPLATAESLTQAEPLASADLIVSDASAIRADLQLQNRLRVLDRLAKKLIRRRESRGAIDFESIEAKVNLDDAGMPIAVALRTKTAATSLVEEVMILTNEVVANHMLEHKAAMVYRVHEEPFQAALEQLLPTLQEFGLAQQGAPQTAFDIQLILAQSEGRPEHALISQLLLRAMKRAVYSPVFSGHFGLASKAYCHFTSPIRRYPDLLTHRLLKQQLIGEGAQSSLVPASSAMIAQLPWLCEHSSEMEREAEQASLEATALKLCEYLAPRVGERFNGIIVGINNYGFYVREDTTTAEGFVNRDDLPEDIIYDESRHRFTAGENGHVYRLGQRIVVELRGVDLSQVRLDFVVVSARARAGAGA